MNKDHQLVESLTHDIYDAALDASKWPEVYHRIAKVLAAGYTVFTQSHVDSNIDHFASSIPPSLFNPDTAECQLLLRDWSEQAKQSPVGHCLCLTAVLFPGNVERRTDIHAAIAGYIESNNEHSALLVLHREKNQSPFGPADTEFMNCLLPHLCRAQKINKAVGMAGHVDNGKRQLFAALESPAFLVQRNGQLSPANAAAMKLDDWQSDVFLEKGIFKCRHKENQRKLSRFINEVIKKGFFRDKKQVKSLSLLNSDGAPVCLLTARPLRHIDKDSGLLSEDVRAVLIAQTLSEIELNYEETMKMTYQLTPAEIRVLKALVSGLKVADIADKHQLSKSTVRNQIKSCFLKTGTHRQLELINLAIAFMEETYR